MLIQKKSPKIVVIRSLGGIGDALMLTPVFRGLKEKYPNCYITLATSWAYMGGSLPLLFRNNPYIDRIERVEPSEFVTGITRHVRWEFRETPNHHVPPCITDADIVIDLNVICSIVETNTQPNVTETRTEIWCRHCAGGVTPSIKKPILCLDKSELEEGKQWVEGHLGDGVRIGIVLQAHDPVRSWPHATDFAIHLLMKKYRVVTIDMNRRAHDEIPAIVGKHIRQTAAIIAHLDAVVSPDSGILHVAGAMGVPILGLFGSTNGELRMREYCGHYVDGAQVSSCAPCWYLKPCLKSKNPADHAMCMKRLNIPVVMNELETMLKRFDVVLP